MRCKMLLLSILCFGFAASVFGVDVTDYTSEWSFKTGEPVLITGPGALVGVNTDTDGPDSIGGEACTHFGPHDGSAGYELRVNRPEDPHQFTMIFDLFVADDNSDTFLPLWQGSATNSNDAELFLRPTTGGYWSSGYVDTPTIAWVKGQWNRFVYVNDYDAGSSQIYVNGELSHDFGLSPDYIYSGITNPAWLLTDNAGETTDAYILNFAFTDQLLTAEDAADLGSANSAGVFITEGIAWNPMPYDGQGIDDSAYVPVDQVLSWSTGVDANDVPMAAITGHYIYIDKNKDAITDVNTVPGSSDYTLAYTASLPVADENYQPSTDGGADLDRDSVYYWRVDELLPNNEYIQGAVWAFGTTITVPEVTQHPQDTAVFPTETAVMTVTATSVSPLNYQWKKVDAAGDIDVPGATSATLTIPDVDMDDEGYYYCVLTNDSATPVNSEQALLTVKRKLVHLPLDGDTLAGAGTTIDGVGNGDLEWVTGISGNAVNLTQDNADPNILDYIKLADDANDLLFADRTDFTVSLWVKSAGGWEEDPSIISNKDWYSGTNVGWAIAAESGGDSWQWNYYTTSSSRDDYDPLTQSIIDGEWHHILVSHDRDGNAALFFDGAQRAVVDISDHTSTIDAGLPTVIGTGGAEGAEWPYGFVGAVDEVEIWNYTMDRVEVATMYTDLAGGWICVADQENPNASSVMDFNADCQVDLLDFMEFALEWMDCNLVPAAGCGL